MNNRPTKCGYTQPKENKAKAICKVKVTSDNSEVCIGVYFVFFVFVFFFF